MFTCLLCFVSLFDAKMCKGLITFAPQFDQLLNMLACKRVVSACLANMKPLTECILAKPVPEFMRWSTVFCHWRLLVACLAVKLLLLDVSSASFQESLFCPKGCLCPTEQEVICDGVMLEKIPQEMSPKLRNLTIARATMARISGDDFRYYPLLERLTLNYCEIERIEGYTFHNLTKLRYLSLVGNPLSDLQSYSFANLHSLKEVIVRADALEQLPAYLFFGSENIRGLDLRSTSITRIQRHAFSGLYNVQFLHLPLNLVTIEPEAFYNCTRVHFLDIRNWQANRSEWIGVAPRTFHGLGHVSSMRIDQSSLGVLWPKAFDELETVETLQIHNSRITSIRSSSFAGMRNVGSLQLLNNQIGHIARYAFQEIPGDQVYELQFMENDLDCSCRNGWLVHNFQKLSNDTLKRNYCSSPDLFLQQQLGQIDPAWIINCTKKYDHHHLDTFSRAPLSVDRLPIPMLILLITFAFILCNNRFPITN
ncbi:Chondroadherin [Trichinella spiralis]|uniref:Chondroadherin n=2 Tax=Trichinella spiralis TaxID=6334 RepID=A0A0V1AXM8_TRISP|nr:Chondroadherin [Trichinella spiralis]